MSKPYEIRDPVHGFVTLNELEWDIINQPSFQRLRRIRQLAWTDMVYPAASHNRFEHSLGVMHVASRLFETLRSNDFEILKSEYKFEQAGLDRQRQIIRLAALLHDVGHGPFSHATEEMYPINPVSGKIFRHEDYTIAVIDHVLKDVIENHPMNTNNFRITTREIADLFSGEPITPKTLVWKNLVSGQMDADRMDYLLRDAYHVGVNYGRFDLDRVAATVTLCADPEIDAYDIGISEDGIHAVEGLLIARYMMFTQLYFHKTRSIYDYHLGECLKHLLSSINGTFPAPDADNIDAYLDWDDWRVLGAIANGCGGAHGEILKNRQHYRLVYQTSEVADSAELEQSKSMFEKLSDYGAVTVEARKSWYKFQKEEIGVKRTSGGIDERTVPLSTLSPVVKGLTTVNQHRIYVPIVCRESAKAKLKELSGGGK